MKEIFKKSLSLILILPFCFSPPAYASDGEDTADETAVFATGEDISAKTAVLVEESTGTVLYDKNSHEKLPPASITKIMTMLLVMEAIEDGKCSMDDIITASANAVSMGGSQIWLKENEQMSLRDLMKACAIGSANDAAMALAEHIGGSEEGFVAMMNNKAAQLCMNDTTFINPTGLDADGHLSSAHDIALMSRELLKHEEIKGFTTTWMDSLRGGKTSLVNTNKLVRFYEGCTGLKTGTTDGAGSCVSVSASKNNFSLIAVTMGSATSKERFDSARRLLDFGFATYTFYDIVPPESGYGEVIVKGGTTDRVSLKAASDSPSRIIIPKASLNKITEEIKFEPEISAPVEKNQLLGEVIIKSEENEIEKIKLTAADDVAKMTVFKAFIKILTKII